MCAYPSLNFQTRYPKHTYFLFGQLKNNKTHSIFFVALKTKFNVQDIGLMHFTHVNIGFTQWALHRTLSLPSIIMIIKGHMVGLDN